MKKILSLALAAVMMVSVLPVAYAAPVDDEGGVIEDSTIPEVGKTTVTLVGSEESVGSYYEVEVPASMIPGGNADITVEGNWKSTETLKVSAPEKVTLYYGDQSMDVAIEFDSIAQVGNDKVGSTATANLKIADASVKFGTWTGVIEYTVELAETSTDSGSGSSIPGGPEMS